MLDWLGRLQFEMRMLKTRSCEILYEKKLELECVGGIPFRDRRSRHLPILCPLSGYA